MNTSIYVPEYLDTERLIALIRMSDIEILDAIMQELEDDGNYIIQTDGERYLFAIPTTDQITPLLLMSQANTNRLADYPDVKRYGNTLYLGTESCGSLGADSRMGVHTCLEVAFRLDARPYLLFTFNDDVDFSGINAFCDALHAELPHDYEPSFWQGKYVWEPYFEYWNAILQFGFQGMNYYTASGDSAKQFELQSAIENLGYVFSAGPEPDAEILSQRTFVPHLYISSGVILAGELEEKVILQGVDMAIDNGLLLSHALQVKYSLLKEGETFDEHYQKPVCDICEKPRSTEYILNAHANVCRKCINRAGGVDNITVESFDKLREQLQRERAVSQLANWKRTIPCPVDKEHDYIIKEAHNPGVFYCHDCKVHFTKIGEEYWYWRDEIRTAVIRASDGEIFETASPQSPADRCFFCGIMMLKKSLHTIKDVDGNNVLMVCPDCNAVSTATKE